MRLVRQEAMRRRFFPWRIPGGNPRQYDKYAVPPIDFKRRLARCSGCAPPRMPSTAVEARRRIRSLLSDFQPQLAHVRNIYHHLSPSILWELRRKAFLSSTT